MIKLKIKVTKDILRRSMMCGTKSYKGLVSQGCAISLACQEVFPECSVSAYISNGARVREGIDKVEWFIKLPHEARLFVGRFDELSATPEQRLDLPGLEFEVELTDEVLEALPINIDEAKRIIEGSETLELCE